MKNINKSILLVGTLSCFSTQAQVKPEWPSPVPEIITGQVFFDRLELTRTNARENRAVWDMQAWYGRDYHRAVFKSEGENTQNDGKPTDLERAELLYGYLVSPFWSFQVGAGVKGELSSESNLEEYAVFSFSGLAPYWFEMENSLRINKEGDIQFVGEAEYEWLLSQTSYLQPRIELVANITDSEKYDRESGFSDIRIGLRYRQEIAREFAPYIGVYWSESLGNKRDKLKRLGEDTSEKGIVIGARLWF